MTAVQTQPSPNSTPALDVLPQVVEALPVSNDMPANIGALAVNQMPSEGLVHSAEAPNVYPEAINTQGPIVTKNYGEKTPLLASGRRTVLIGRGTAAVHMRPKRAPFKV